jgi:L-alanine-DL-glutamate epimerase-like enolase superfamily enzyme
LKRGLNNDVYIIRSRSTDGVVGIAVAHDYIQYLYPILQRLIIPYFLGKDVRDLKDLLDGVYRFRSNYKLAGLALWCCIAWVEISLLDLLGKYLQKPIVEVLGGQLIDKVPVYLSSVRRDTTPEQEIAWIEKRLKETGARVVKFKIGGRMSMNIDAMPKRTETLVMRARKTFGDQITLGVDGNGSFDAKHGIEIGKFLESFGVAFFEEPCPFDDFAATERVTKSLNLTITGGEQETSLARFEYMARHGVVNVLQPDLIYNGGFIRTLRVAEIAARSRIPLTIHNARLGIDSLYMAQFASFLPGVYQEYNAASESSSTWCAPSLTIKDGMLHVPRGAGLGIEIDPDLLRRAHRFQHNQI